MAGLVMFDASYLASLKNTVTRTDVVRKLNEFVAYTVGF